MQQVEFEKPVDAKGNIEVWLQRLVDGMQDTIKQVWLRLLLGMVVSEAMCRALFNVACASCWCLPLIEQVTLLIPCFAHMFCTPVTRLAAIGC